MQNSRLLKIFAESKIETSDKIYSFVSIPVKHWSDLIVMLSEDEFVSITKDREEEISCIIETEKWEAIDKKAIQFSISSNWRLFSLFGEGLMETPGYLAKICLLLAQNNITLMAFSTFKKSHIFVKCPDYSKAQAILKIFLTQQA